jgi:hypothetical protein
LFFNFKKLSSENAWEAFIKHNGSVWHWKELIQTNQTSRSNLFESRFYSIIFFVQMRLIVYLRFVVCSSINN